MVTPDTASGVEGERKAPFVSTGSMTGVPLHRAEKLCWRSARMASADESLDPVRLDSNRLLILKLGHQS